MAYELPKRPTKKAMEQANAVMELRVKGISYREIGKRLGISYQQAYRAQALAVREIPRENLEQYTELQEHRVERLMARALDISEDAPSHKDQISAINTALKATDQLNRLRGIYTEQENEGTTTVGTLLDTLINTSINRPDQD